MLEKMKSLAREKDICVLATVSNKKPHCSLMAYVTDDECREIYMVSHKQTRKYKNLLENPSASLLIDTREENLGTSRPEAKALTVALELNSWTDTPIWRSLSLTLTQRSCVLR
jgi:nitroimidazol reductase NimA-like FMN-containing flavoprotein (pyridoxamine 5'-phosphate oxidase superfamily)